MDTSSVRRRVAYVILHLISNRRYIIEKLDFLI